MPVFRIRHLTKYQYSGVVRHGHSEARLIPLDMQAQKVLSWNIHITPEPRITHRREDFFGNQVLYFSLEDPHQELAVEANSVVETWFLPLPTKPSTRYIEIRSRIMAEPAFFSERQYLLSSVHCPLGREFRQFFLAICPPNTTLLDALGRLGEIIKKDFTYDRHFTTIHTPVMEILKHRRGVCQDFAHLCISLFRSVGVPARYVSGYLETQPPPGKEKLRGADASHAWFAVFDPNLGWLEFDPTNNKFPDDSYIRLAWGRDYADVSPLKGVLYEGGSQTLQVAVDVDRIAEQKFSLISAETSH
ncbi:MAG: transglutaminase family protein [Leptospiraceae bacterium]|nr:transglutaminase family protein [Leptospiraceae bacterium]MDW8306660.1 transglutaminase family protein [Leptospiraceae bacterium]